MDGSGGGASPPIAGGVFAFHIGGCGGAAAAALLVTGAKSSAMADFVAPTPESPAEPALIGSLHPARHEGARALTI